MAKQSLFITGTDTGVGKTLVTCGLIKAIQEAGQTVLAMKPIAAGCEETDLGLRNEDAVLMQQCMNEELPYELINPVAVKAAIAPHIAAEQEGKSLNASRINGFIRGMQMRSADYLLVEGAGGWRLPLNHRETLARVIRELEMPVILVVGLKLGCLNHALLSAESIQRDGLQLQGWVGSVIDSDMEALEENVASLQQMLPAPCLGVIPHLQEGAETDKIDTVARQLDIGKLAQPA